MILWEYNHGESISDFWIILENPRCRWMLFGRLTRVSSDEHRLPCRCYTTALMEDRAYSLPAPFGGFAWVAAWASLLFWNCFSQKAQIHADGAPIETSRAGTLQKRRSMRSLHGSQLLTSPISRELSIACPSQTFLRFIVSQRSIVDKSLSVLCTNVK